MPPIISPFNKLLVLRGVSASLIPSLRGQTVFESEVAFRLNSPSMSPGILTQQIIRASGGGLLTFAYRITLTETDHDGDLGLAVLFSQPGLVVTFADFRADGTGITPPNQFESSPMEGYSFKFNHGLAAGRQTRFCFIATNAREFVESGGTVKLHTGRKSISLDVAAPLGTSPSRWIDVSRSDAEPSADESSFV